MRNKSGTKYETSPERLPPPRGLTPSALQRWARQRRDELGLTVRQVARRAATNDLGVLAFEGGDCASLNLSRKLTRLYGVPLVLYTIWTGFLQPADLAEWGRWNNGHDSAGSTCR